MATSGARPPGGLPTHKNTNPRAIAVKKVATTDVIAVATETTALIPQTLQVTDEREPPRDGNTQTQRGYLARQLGHVLAIQKSV